MDAYGIKHFYNTKVGRVVRRLLQQRIREIWSDVKAMDVVGCGYAAPYMRMLKEQAVSASLMMPAPHGVHHWPHDGKNCVCLSSASDLPLATNSVDRMVLVHSLEFSEDPAGVLQETWRVLKSNGRALIIVPNRAGLWAHVDWAPFGHGRPYSLSQIRAALQENLFIEERVEEALFMPPIHFSLLLKSAGIFEHVGANYLPIASGVHMIEVSKQIYAKTGRGTPVPAYAAFKPKSAT